MSTRGCYAPGVLASIALAEAALIRLGRTYGSTRQERALRLPGDGIVDGPEVVTDHAITIDAPPSAVWPWLVQVGWGQGGWYTARWVDRLLFPANAASADRGANEHWCCTPTVTCPRAGGNVQRSTGPGPSS